MMKMKRDESKIIAPYRRQERPCYSSFTRRGGGATPFAATCLPELGYLGWFLPQTSIASKWYSKCSSVRSCFMLLRRP